MVDSILIQNGKAHEIWRGTAKKNLPPLHADLVAQIVEVPDDTVNGGDLWDGKVFTVPPTPIPERVKTRSEKFDDVAAKSGLTPDELIAEMKTRLAR
jgi:hypothetical protein